MKRVGVLVGLMAVITAACSEAPSGEDPFFRFVSLDGTVRVRHDGQWISAEEDTELSRGDLVSVGTDGSARLELAGGTRLELGELARLALLSPVEPRLIRGSMLAETRRPVKIAAKGFSVEAERGSVLRVDLLTAHRVGVYDGEVTVPGSGWSSGVAALSQLDIVAGNATTGPSPLRILPDDPWDLRMLGEAIDIGAALDQKESGLRAQLHGEAARIALDRVLGPAVSAPDRAALLAEFLPEAIVVAAIIAREIGEEPTVHVLREILTLRTGAGWELVAGRWDVARSVLQTIGELAGDVLQQIRRATPPPTRPAAASPRSGSGGSGGSSSSGSGGGSGGGGSGGGGGGGGKKNGPSNPGPEDPPPCDSLECTVTGVIGDAPII